jgi:hypothetical protein
MSLDVGVPGSAVASGLFRLEGLRDHVERGDLGRFARHRGPLLLPSPGRSTPLISTTIRSTFAQVGVQAPSSGSSRFARLSATTATCFVPALPPPGLEYPSRTPRAGRPPRRVVCAAHNR